MKFIKENFDKSVERERKIARFLESKENERKLSFGKKDSVRKWYEHDFADDAVSVEDMDPSITFEMAASYVVPDANGEDRFYNKMGSVDSFVRENIFTKIAEIYGVSYDDVYETWMGTPDTKLLDALKADGVVECLTEEKEDGAESVYRVTYKASDKIFSSFMIKAKDKDDAIDKAMAYRKKKYDKDTDIVGAEKMSASEVDDYKRRGMSLVESIDPDKEYKGRMMIINYKKGNSSLEQLHKDLVDLFDGDIKTAFNFLVDNESVKIKESVDADIEKIKQSINGLTDHPMDALIYPTSTTDKQACVKKNKLSKGKYVVWFVEDGEQDVVDNDLTIDQAAKWIKKNASSLNPKQLKKTQGVLNKEGLGGNTVSRKASNVVVTEDKDSDKENVRSAIEALSNGDVLVYKVADKSFPELYIMRNSEKPEYLVLWNESDEGEIANLVKYSSVDNAVYWVINTAISYTPKKLKNKHVSFKEGKRVCEDMEEPEEIPASPETMDAMSVANTLNALIQDEWQAIDGYNGTISTYRAMAQDDYPEKDNSIDYDAIIKILEDIAQEEMNHVGMLQKAMGTISPNVSEIKGGEEEAEETLENPEAVEVVGEEDAE